MDTPGYSGTPLLKKLGIRPDDRICVLDAPNPYSEMVQGLPESVTLEDKLCPGLDIVHLFVTQRSVLEARLPRAMKNMRQAGAIWVSWPKKAAKMTTDVTEDVIREVALPLGLVDVKVCAVSAIWSGLRLVIRKENRKKEKG